MQLRQLVVPAPSDVPLGCVPKALRAVMAQWGKDVSMFLTPETEAGQGQLTVLFWTVPEEMCDIGNFLEEHGCDRKRC